MNSKTAKSKNKKVTDALKGKLRNDFVQGVTIDNALVYPTLDQLAKKYKVAKSRLYRIARNDSWKIQKEQHIQELQDQLDKQRSKELVAKSKSFDDKSINLANALYATIGQMIQSNQLQIQAGEKGYSPTQLNALSQSAITAQRLAKLALGEATHNIDATINENNEAFRRAMELLDAVEEGRSRDIQPTH